MGYIFLSVPRDPSGEGQRWADHLQTSLLTTEALQHCQDLLYADAEIGLLSPAGSLVPIALHLDRNYNSIASYQHSSQVDGPWLLEQNYIAGSMMAGQLRL